jgi:hypothetical protein
MYLTFLEFSEYLIILGALARNFLSLDRKVSGMVVILVRFHFFGHVVKMSSVNDEDERR